MKRLCPLILFNFIIIETVRAHQTKNKSLARDDNFLDMVEVLGNRQDLVDVAEYKKGSQFKAPSYSPWSRWAVCNGGRRVRRRHCLRRDICGDSLRIEIASCRRLRSRTKILAHEDIGNNLYDYGSPVQMYQRKQLDSNDVQKKFRGFSPWGPWSSCSRKCTTVRRRYCQKRVVCGRKVIRQSAYCYVEGSYCQHWIGTRMQRRKDPGEHAHRYFAY